MHLSKEVVTVAQINAPHNIRIIWWQEQEFNIRTNLGHELSTQRGAIDSSSTIFESSNGCKIKGFGLLQDEISPCCHTGGCCSCICFLCCSMNSIGAIHYPTHVTELAITYCILSYLPTPYYSHSDRYILDKFCLLSSSFLYLALSMAPTVSNCGIDPEGNLSSKQVARMLC